MSTLIFLDLETTGLDPVESNLILEIGMLAVSCPDFVEIEAWSTPVFHGGQELVNRCNNFVFAMHQESGLVEELRKMNAGERPRVLPKAALLEALAFFNRHAQDADRERNHKPEVVLCGANPEFDRRYLKVWMPDLEKRFHYRNFDVNSLFLLRRWVFGGPAEKLGTKHRAIDDCRQAVAGVHAFFEAVAGGYAARITELETALACRAQAHADDLARADAMAGVP